MKVEADNQISASCVIEPSFVIRSSLRYIWFAVTNHRQVGATCVGFGRLDEVRQRSVRERTAAHWKSTQWAATGRRRFGFGRRLDDRRWDRGPRWGRFDGCRVPLQRRAIIDRNVLPRRTFRHIARVVVPVRIVVPVTGEVAPFTALLVPETLAADTLLTGATSRSRCQRSGHRRPKAVGWQAPHPRRRWWSALSLGPCFQGCQPAQVPVRLASTTTSVKTRTLAQRDVTNYRCGRSDLRRDLMVGCKRDCFGADVRGQCFSLRLSRHFCRGVRSLYRLVTERSSPTVNPALSHPRPHPAPTGASHGSRPHLTPRPSTHVAGCQPTRPP